MRRSTDRILTTHVGSLPRPHDLLDLLKARLDGQPYDERVLATRVRGAVAEIVQKQVECGVDIIDDGEQSKAGFTAYLRERLSGFEPREVAGEPGENSFTRGLRSPASPFAREIQAFPEYYEWYLGAGNMQGITPTTPLRCTGPVTYTGLTQLQTDLDNLKAAVMAAGKSPEDVFVPATTGRGVGRNEYYSTEEEFLLAVSDAVRVEYQAIIDAGFLLQIDDPGITNLWGQNPGLPLATRRTNAEQTVELINYSLRGIPPERIRFHCCYGINEGPRVYDEPLRTYVELLFKINAAAYSFESANPRHAWSWHVFEEVTLPEGKVLIPGCISHAHNIVEHPEYIADLIMNYARLVGRENVIAGADCGFSSQATYTPEVHASVVWAKFRALAEGARLATKRLWGR